MSEVTEDPISRARRLMAGAAAEAADHSREWMARHTLQRLADTVERLVVARIGDTEPPADDLLRALTSVGLHLGHSYWQARTAGVSRAELYKTLGHWYERGQQQELARAQYDAAWQVVDRLAAGVDAGDLTITILTDPALVNAPVMLAVILKAIAGNGVYAFVTPQPGTPRQQTLPAAPASDQSPGQPMEAIPTGLDEPDRIGLFVFGLGDNPPWVTFGPSPAVTFETEDARLYTLLRHLARIHPNGSITAAELATLMPSRRKDSTPKHQPRRFSNMCNELARRIPRLDIGRRPFCSAADGITRWVEVEEEE